MNAWRMRLSGLVLLAVKKPTHGPVVKKIKIHTEKMQESVLINRKVPIKKDRDMTADKQGCPGSYALQSEQRMNQRMSHNGVNTEDTESTSKWSELSGVCSQEELQCHLSLAQSQQFIWEEELRARQFSALFRLRKKALWKRAQAELTWLEHCKKNALSDKYSVNEIRKKQEEVLSRFRREEAEIRHWRNVNKCGQQQRRLLLHHQRDILDINKSTNHIRQVLENQAMTKTDSRPRDTASVLRVKSVGTKPGIIPADSGTEKLPSKKERFFTKAGLRRLLTTDEVWSLRRKSLGEPTIPTEQEVLQTPGSKDLGDPKCFPVYNHGSKSCHNTRNDRQVQKDDGKPLYKREVLNAIPKAHGYESTPAKNVTIHHSIGSPTKSTEINSRDKVQWKSVNDGHHFTSEQSQPSCGSFDNIPIGSCLSSDIEKALPYDYEDIYHKPGKEPAARFQEQLKPDYSSFEMTVDCGEVKTDNVSLNVQNRHQSVVLNNNHEICDVVKKLNTVYSQAHNTDLASQTSQNLKRQNMEDLMIDKALVINTVVPVSSNMKGTDSVSCDDSFSEAEDKSEPFSLQSEGLVCSEEEKDLYSEINSEPETFALVYAEKFTVIPDSPLYLHKSNNEQCVVEFCGLIQNEHHIRAESNLSEILSPVDEILSYGSVELPSSLKVGGGPGLEINNLAPPSPAFEIITWTSEEDLPALPDFIEDPSIHSENISPLPVDLSCKEDTERPSETSVKNDAYYGEFQMLQTAENNPEDEGSENISFHPVDDSEDPLSFFNIGDRVIVCNSRPGVLKYKGYTAFSDGVWAGVALDIPKGNHNGTFRGVKYFTCEKSCGVLVRAEDISHLHENDGDTGTDQDTYLDEVLPNSQDGKIWNKPTGKGQRRQSGSGHGSLAPKLKFQQEPCDNNDGIERLTEEIFGDALKNIPGKVSTHDGRPKEITFKKKETGNTITKPGLTEKWQQVRPLTPPQIRIEPHEHTIVYKLVDNTVETLCGQANRRDIDACEAPNYLADDKSCKTYRRVISQLASDILNKISGDILEMNGTLQKTMDTSIISLGQTGHISVNLLKDAVRRETQKVLNLKKNNQEMTEMLQTLCKYRYDKRDKVDYILIQELHNEEKDWVDYSNDQITLKMQLADEIFSYLLDDTILVLNQIYAAGHN